MLGYRSKVTFNEDPSNLAIKRIDIVRNFRDNKPLIQLHEFFMIHM